MLGPGPSIHALTKIRVHKSVDGRARPSHAGHGERPHPTVLDLAGITGGNGTLDALPLSPPEETERWMTLRFALSAAPETVAMKVKTPQRFVKLEPEVYGPVIEALAGGPRSLSQLMDIPVLGATGPGAVQMALLLAGAGHVESCLDAEGDAARAARTAAFNEAALRRALVV